MKDTLTPEDFQKALKAKHSFRNGNRIYHIAIIDYLQDWNMNKKTERFLKTKILLKDGKTLSAIEPKQYAERFQRFMEVNVF